MTEVEISVVIPLFNEQDSLNELYEQIAVSLASRSYEIIFVDDGSTDKSWNIISALCNSHPNVKGIQFRRNYGKSNALQRGFDVVRGKYVVTLDADLQDDPAEIPEMINMLDSGLDLVSGWKKQRHDPVSKTIPSRFFNWVTSKVTGIALHDFNCGLKAYRSEVVKSIELYGELHRYIPLLAHWEGFVAIGEKVVNHRPRKYGKTKFGLSRFMNGFLDLLTLVFIHSYLSKPMHFFGTIGFLSLVGGAMITIYLAITRIFFDQYLSNRPLLLFGILMLVLGVQLFSIGFLGEMLNKARKKKVRANIKETKGVSAE